MLHKAQQLGTFVLIEAGADPLLIAIGMQACVWLSIVTGIFLMALADRQPRRWIAFSPVQR